MISARYGRLARQLEMEIDRTSLIVAPQLIQKGSDFFVHKYMDEQGMKMVHRIDYGQPIKDYMKGIREDDYQFYDDYPDCKEVLIVGSSNSGKSSLINALNDTKEIARVRKLSGKT